MIICVSTVTIIQLGGMCCVVMATKDPGNLIYKELKYVVKSVKIHGRSATYTWSQLTVKITYIHGNRLNL